MKITTLALGIAFLTLMVNPAVFGQNIEISIPNSSGAPGSTVTVPINVGDTTGHGIISFEMILQYDPQFLSPVAAHTSGTIDETWQAVLNAINPGEVYIGMMGLNPLSGSGVLVNISFMIQPTAQIGSTYQLHFVKALLNDGTATTSDGIISVERVAAGERIPGDINGDNRVNRLDLLKLIIVYNKESGDSGYNPSADLNSDGRIDKSDMIILWENFGVTKE